MGEEEPQKPQEPQGFRHRAVCFVAEGRVMMRNEGADADHLRLQPLHEAEILQQTFLRLTRCPHHHAAAHLVADFLEIIETADPVFKRELGGMQMPVMQGICGFMPQ